MRKSRFALLAMLMVVIGGCVPSFYPLFTQNEWTYDPALSGIWQDKDQKVTFTLTGHPDTKSYQLQSEGKEGTTVAGSFHASLGTVGKHRFLELFPHRPSDIYGKNFFGGHFTEMFSFWKVELNGDNLTLKPLNYQWLEGMLKAKKVEIKHEQREGGFIMLTASTEELKAFVLKYADDKYAFSEGFVLQRKTKETAQPRKPSAAEVINNQRDQCISNLRLLQAAKDQWALENKKTTTDTPVVADMKPYLSGHYETKITFFCPLDKTKTFTNSYKINRMDEVPECKIDKSHKLP